MLQDLGEEGLNELHLFHGTASSAVDAICAENFDFRLSGAAHGTAMGHGTWNYPQGSRSDCSTCACGMVSHVEEPRLHFEFNLLQDVVVNVIFCLT